MAGYEAAHWTIDDLDFSRIAIERIRGDDTLFYLACSASFIESGSDLYTHNLVDFFAGDEAARLGYALILFRLAQDEQFSQAFMNQIASRRLDGSNSSVSVTLHADSSSAWKSQRPCSERNGQVLSSA